MLARGKRSSEGFALKRKDCWLSSEKHPAGDLTVASHSRVTIYEHSVVAFTYVVTVGQPPSFWVNQSSLYRSIWWRILVNGILGFHAMENPNNARRGRSKIRRIPPIPPIFRIFAHRASGIARTSSDIRRRHRQKILSSDFSRGGGEKWGSFTSKPDPEIENLEPSILSLVKVRK